MKAINPRVFVRASNAWGGDGSSYTQHFEIEESDVGRRRNDHRASPNHNPSISTQYEFKRADVGRRICVQDNGNWHMFNFV